MADTLSFDRLNIQEADDATHEELGRRFEEGAARERADRELITETYKSVWKYFHEWDFEDCKQNISGLHVVSERLAYDGWLLPTTSQLEDDMLVDGASNDWTFEVTDIQDDIETTKITTAIVRRVEKLRPYPKYEACTPVSQNIMSDENVSELRFIPYADEPGFDVDEHVNRHRTIAWKTKTNDPNSE
ncbi:hypothetical protein CERSUDRAFT_97211 [Gelatoporia subvermispora B]|uniref:Uncharacterized protein n=1 Tax=Ceriporiopsis subvermispora (strain B) TaxID=914234 RepID=M2R862_CERS8|nr:hypothetical protein CERSUDRAFT_97211 [Gelatoporia subvermispora B]